MSEGMAVAQAFIEARADDPEADSALAVARANLEAGRALSSLCRMRLFELSGSLPPRAALEGLLHRSTQFYNPGKERCVVRMSVTDLVPGPPGGQRVLVFERGGERRAAAERWWRHETGARIQVREGVVWAMRFAGEADAAAAAESLTVTLDRTHGLLCNPHFQEWRPAPEPGTAPLPWISTKAIARGPRARKGKVTP